MSAPSPFAPSRRDTLRWVAAAAALGGTGAGLAGCGPSWPNMRLVPVEGPGYGGDPDLVQPSAPWPLTLSPAEREIVRLAADLILPGDDRSPSAGSLGVDAFVDEWISAPYERQQQDRALIVPGLAWLERESRRRFRRGFAAADDAQRAALFDDIAFRDRLTRATERPGAFFARLRALVMVGFYTLPEGLADIGYMGGVPLTGDYPGPSEEALEHLRGKLAELGLAPPVG